jgi:hypothetical protein
MPPLNGPANDQNYLTYNIYTGFKYQCLDQDNLVQLYWDLSNRKNFDIFAVFMMKHNSKHTVKKYRKSFCQT